MAPSRISRSTRDSKEIEAEVERGQWHQSIERVVEPVLAN